MTDNKEILESIRRGAEREEGDLLSPDDEHEKERKEMLHKVTMFFMEKGISVIMASLFVVFSSLLLCFIVYILHLILPSRFMWLSDIQLNKMEFISLSIITASVVNITTQLIGKLKP